LSLRAFSSVDRGLASLSWQAEGPARCLSSAFLLAILKGGNALGVLLAVSPLSGAFLLDALLDVAELGNSGGLGCNCIEAVVVEDTFPEADGIGIALLCEAGAEACNAVTFLVAILERGETLGVLGADL